MFNTKANTLSEEDLKLITREFIMSDDFKIEDLSDKQTMCLYIPLPEQIQKKFEYWAMKQDEATRADISHLWCEYWIEEDECHYVFHGDGEVYAVTEDFDCKYLTDIVRDKYKKVYEVV